MSGVTIEIESDYRERKVGALYSHDMKKTAAAQAYKSK